MKNVKDMKLNKTIIAGKLKANPEIRYTSDESPVAHFELNVKNKENEDFIVQCIAFGGLAKIAGEYLKKGISVAIEGRLNMRKYDSKEGMKKTVTEIIVDNLQIMKRM